jgi:hypothetical protein
MDRSVLLVLALLPAPAPAEVFGGARIQEVYRLRLDRGDLLLESILDAIQKNNIHDGAVLTAAG